MAPTPPTPLTPLTPRTCRRPPWIAMPTPPIPPIRPRRWLLLCAVGLAACAPALNWREVRPAHAEGLLATFPCKPQAAQRQIPLPGLPDVVTVHLLSCEADGSRWALSHLSVSDASLVPVALRALAAATRGNLEVASREAARQAQAASAQAVPEPLAQPAVRASELAPAAVPRMTPQPDSRTWRFEARRPGEGGGASVPLTVTASHFSHGLTVFQASVWQPDEAGSAHSGREGVTTFLQGFHFPG